MQTTKTDPDLTVYEHLEQGSDEWHEARRGVLTASVIGKLITPTLKAADNQTSRGIIAQLAAERISGRPADPIWSKDIERGHLDEPYAREAYAGWSGLHVDEVGFMTLTLDGAVLGYSPDGITSAGHLIEIKSRKPRLQLEHMLGREIPHDHMMQMQAGMLVAGADYCDYVSYAGGMHLIVTRVYQSSRHAEAIRAVVAETEEHIKDLIIEYEGAAKEFPPTEYVDHYAETEIVI